MRAHGGSGLETAGRGPVAVWRGMNRWQRLCALSNIPLLALYCLAHPAPAPPLPPVAVSAPRAAAAEAEILAVPAIVAPAAFPDPFRSPISRPRDAGGLRPGFREPMPLPDNPEVVLPAALRGERFDGAVELRAHIDRKGIVRDVWLLRSSGNDEVDLAAVRTVRRWRYQPALRNGRSVAAIEHLAVLVGAEFRE